MNLIYVYIEQFDSFNFTEHPHWVGWPTCTHIRREFPDRLFVGYTTGKKVILMRYHILF